MKIYCSNISTCMGSPRKESEERKAMKERQQKVCGQSCRIDRPWESKYRFCLLIGQQVSLNS